MCLCVLCVCLRETYGKELEVDINYLIVEPKIFNLIRKLFRGSEMLSWKWLFRHGARIGEYEISNR